jgi:hypothetical protein
MQKTSGPSKLNAQLKTARTCLLLCARFRSREWFAIRERQHQNAVALLFALCTPSEVTTWEQRFNLLA